MNASIEIKSAIVTGVTGPIGFKLLELLASKGVRLLCITHENSARNSFLATFPNCMIEKCGLDGLAKLEPDGEWDAFFHLGWVGSENREARNNAIVQAANIQYGLDAVDLAVRVHCKVFVGAGSQAECGPLPDGVLRENMRVAPVEPYGAAKFALYRLGLSLAEKYDMRFCWGRVLSVYGEYDRPTTLIMYAINCLLRSETPRFTPCEQQWDYMYTGDCAEAFWHIACCGSHGVAYPLGSGIQRPLREYLEEIRQIINPKADMRYGAKPYPKGQVMHMVADMQPVNRDTGFTIKTPFASGVHALLASLN